MYKMNEAIQLNVMNREIKGCQEAVKEKMTSQQNRKKTKRDIHQFCLHSALPFSCIQDNKHTPEWI